MPHWTGSSTGDDDPQTGWTRDDETCHLKEMTRPKTFAIKYLREGRVHFVSSSRSFIWHHDTHVCLVARESAV